MMRNLCLILACGLLLPACEPAEEPAEEAPADTMAAAATISLADMAGTWNFRSVPESGPDTTATEGQIVVTADSWTMMLQDRDPIVGVVTISGDSIMVNAGPFESVRRSGTTVWTESVYRLEGDRLVGTIVAHYETADADSVLRLRTEGTRAP
jgi:hypothetical protein